MEENRYIDLKDFIMAENRKLSILTSINIICFILAFIIVLIAIH